MHVLCLLTSTALQKLLGVHVYTHVLITGSAPEKMGALLADLSSLDNHTSHEGIASNAGGAIYIFCGVCTFQIFPFCYSMP